MDEIALVRAEEIEEKREILRDAEYAFSTWGMPALSEEQIGNMCLLSRLFFTEREVFRALQDHI